MRVTFLRVYLLAYFLLLVGAGISLWRAGILGHVPRVWLVATVVVALGSGVLLAFTTRGQGTRGTSHGEDA